MTSEIITYNQNALAIAADSAVTVNNGQSLKTYNTANKIFMLSKYHPIGILVYNSAIVNHIPVEILIKEYRKRLGMKSFDTVKEYCFDFQKYLEKFLNEQVKINDTNILKQNIIEAYIKHVLYLFRNNSIGFDLKNINIFIKNNLKALLQPSIIECNIPQLFDKSELELLLQNQIRINNIVLNPENFNILIDCFNIYKTFYINQILTGFAICGYGEKEYIPFTIVFETIGIVDRKIFIIREINTEKSPTGIIPLAQRNMIDLFITGVDADLMKDLKLQFKGLIDGIYKKVCEEKNDLLNIINDGISSQEIKDKVNKILDDNSAFKIRSAFENGTFDRLISYKMYSHQFPIMQALPFLSKEELATFCENLVSLQALKHRVSLNPETVGGPIDVAIISKYDGFIWKKRKHYFDSNLNPHFFQNYYLKDNSSDE